MEVTFFISWWIQFVQGSRFILAPILFRAAA